jgi:hypothetical protein
MNLNNETDKVTWNLEIGRLKNMEKMIKKSDDQLFSSKIDLISTT